MNEIDLLIYLLGVYRDEKFPIEQIEKKHSQPLNTLKAMGIIYDAGKQKSIICYKCQDPHPVAVKKIPIGGHGWRCPATGFNKIGDIRRDMGKIDRIKLIEHIRQSIGTNQNKSKFETPIDDLYDLGKLGNERISGNFLLYLKDEHPLSNEDLYDFITLKKSYSDLNILICIYHPLSMRVHELPKEYFIVPLVKLLEYQESSIVFKAHNLNDFLPTHKHIKLLQNPIGRPSTQGNIQAAYNKLSQDKNFIEIASIQQARKIHSEIGSPKTPSVKTIANNLPKMRTAQNPAQK